MKIFVGVIIAIVIVAAGLFFFPHGAQAELRVEKLTIVSAKDSTKKHTFDVEIADTYPTRETGLMNRDKMDPDHGMLFEMASNDITEFWMKNTLIPLDMLFITPDGTIKTIHENAIPQDLTAISSQGPVTGVLELTGGRVKELGINTGDKVEHPFFGGKK